MKETNPLRQTNYYYLEKADFSKGRYFENLFLISKSYYSTNGVNSNGEFKFPIYIDIPTKPFRFTVYYPQRIKVKTKNKLYKKHIRGAAKHLPPDDSPRSITQTCFSPNTIVTIFPDGQDKSAIRKNSDLIDNLRERLRMDTGYMPYEKEIEKELIREFKLNKDVNSFVKGVYSINKKRFDELYIDSISKIPKADFFLPINERYYYPLYKCIVLRAIWTKYEKLGEDRETQLFTYLKWSVRNEIQKDTISMDPLSDQRRPDQQYNICLWGPEKENSGPRAFGSCTKNQFGNLVKYGIDIDDTRAEHINPVLGCAFSEPLCSKPMWAELEIEDIEDFIETPAFDSEMYDDTFDDDPWVEDRNLKSPFIEESFEQATIGNPRRNLDWRDMDYKDVLPVKYLMIEKLNIEDKPIIEEFFIHNHNVDENDRIKRILKKYKMTRDDFEDLIDETVDIFLENFSESLW